MASAAGRVTDRDDDMAYKTTFAFFDPLEGCEVVWTKKKLIRPLHRISQFTLGHGGINAPTAIHDMRTSAYTICAC